MKNIKFERFKYIFTAFAALVISLTAIVIYKTRMEEKTLPMMSQKIFNEITLSLNPIIEGAETTAEDPYLLNWLNEEEDRMALDNFLKSKALEIGCSAIDLASDNTNITYQSAGTQVKMSRSNSRDNWYYQLADSSDNSSLEMYYETLEGTLYVYFNQKVFNNRNKFIGVLGLLIQYEKLADYIKKYEKNNRTIYCLNDSGEIMVHSDQTKIGTIPIYDTYGLLQSPLMNETKKESFHNDKSEHWFFRKGPVFRDIRHMPDLNIYLVVEHEFKFRDLLFSRF